MFYYPDVLQRYRQCFSTIWLAATKGIKVNRRELLKVEISQTCGEILDCVMTEVPPPQSHQPSSQFSLYLSSQLQYGVVIAFHRQCGFLLEEAQQTFERLKRAIDMPETNRLYLMEEAEGAQDRFFGLMKVDQLPSPYEILQAEFVIEAVASQHSLVPGPHTALDMDVFRSPPAAITMRETEQCVTAIDEYFEGDDLLEATTREIDMLMGQPEEFLREVEEIRGCEAPMRSNDQLKETEGGAEQDCVFILDVKSGDLKTTPQQVVVRPKGKPVGGRRRRLASADPQIQIANRAMMEPFGNLLVETRKLSEVLLASPAMIERQTPAQLFSTSCGSLFHVDLQALWKQCAFLTVLPEQDGEILRREKRRRLSGMKQISSKSRLQPAKASCRSFPLCSDMTSDMLSWIFSNLHQFEAVPFEPLLPPEADRSTAAHAFNRLLELLSARQVKVHQTEPYGDITINPPAV